MTKTILPSQDLQNTFAWTGIYMQPRRGDSSLAQVWSEAEPWGQGLPCRQALEGRRNRLLTMMNRDRDSRF